MIKKKLTKILQITIAGQFYRNFKSKISANGFFLSLTKKKLIHVIFQ